jgi:transcriptional regulator with XRE-family HTH domain
MDFDLMRQRLVQAREFCGYNRKQFASVIGLPYRTITNYENGAREPGSEYITKVADICGCTTDWLLGLTESARVAVPNETAEGDQQVDVLLAVCAGLNAAAIGRVISYAEDLAWNPANKKG